VNMNLPARRLSIRLHLMPAIIFLIPSLIFYGLWNETKQKEKETLRLLTENTANQVGIRLESFFRTRFNLVEQLHNDWILAGPYDQASFRDRTALIQKNTQGFLAINWIDATGIIRWVTPEKPNRKAKGLDLTTHKDDMVREAILTAMRTRQTNYTPPVVLAQGGLGVVSYVPLVRGEKLEGFLNAVFRVRPLLDECLRKGVKNDFDFRIYEAGREIYRHDSALANDLDSYAVNVPFLVGDIPWMLELKPNAQTTKVSVAGVQIQLLLVGQLLSLFAAVGIHLLFRHQIKLAGSEMRYSALFANANDAIILIRDFAVIDCNPKTYRMFRCSPRDLPRLAFQLFDNDHGSGVTSAVLVREKSEEALSGLSHFFEGVFQRLDGSTFPAEIYLTSLPVGEERMIQMIIRDISERKKAEAQLLESKEKYRHLVENAADAIFIIQNGNILFANPMTWKMAACDEPTLKRLRFSDLVHPEDVKPANQYLENPKDKAPIKLRLHNLNQEQVWVLVSAVNIPWEDQESILVFARDITLRIELEQRLLHSQKMESVGTLAGGIAHDFNNLLMGIQGYTSLMLANEATCTENREKLQAVESQIQSGAHLTQQLLGFARGGKYDVQPTDLVNLISESGKMFGRTHKDLSIHTTFKSKHPVVEVDRTQMEQVMLNLYLNAWQANSKEIYLEMGDVHLNAAFCSSHHVPMGDYLEVRIQDTGEGMDQATCERVFEPFFSKRERGRGTGLGLASAYGIIKNHGGIITVESHPGEGSTFTINLPVSHKPVIKEKRSASLITPGCEHVLIVDDEEMVLKVGCAMLEKLGYQVTTAASGEKALEQFREAHGQIDLVVLDMIMPGLSGGDLFDALAEIDPGVKVLLSSGYSLSREAKHILAKGVSGFIQKPYTLASFSTKIREVLCDGSDQGNASL